MKPTPVVYVGPGDGVRLAPVHGDVWCPRGEPIDVDPALAEALLEQDAFDTPKTSKSSTDKGGTSHGPST